MAAVAYREPDTAAAARRRLRPANRRVRTYRLVPHESARETVAGLIEAVHAIDDGVLHVTGWEEAFGGDAFAERIYDLNFLRESIVEHPATQVWWMPVAFRDAFMARAPDTWSVVKLKMALADPEEYARLSPAVAELVRGDLGLSHRKPIPARKLCDITRADMRYRRLGKLDIDSIAQLTNLEILHLQGLDVQNLTALTHLKKLRSLSLLRCKLDDISFIGEFADLEQLDLTFTRLVDIKPLRRCQRLRDLSLMVTNIHDVSPLANNPNIVRLNIGGTHVREIDVISRMHSLKEVYMWGTPVEDISAFKKISTLERVGLRRSKVSNLQYISVNTNLKWLDLSETNVTDISALGTLDRLEVLDLHGNNLSDISSLFNLKNLKKLDLSNTLVPDNEIRVLIEALPDCSLGPVTGLPWTPLV